MTLSREQCMRAIGELEDIMKVLEEEIEEKRCALGYIKGDLFKLKGQLELINEKEEKEDEC